VKNFPQGREAKSRRQAKKFNFFLITGSGEEPLDLFGILNLSKISMATYPELLSD
jgi:hypothetical protein